MGVKYEDIKDYISEKSDEIDEEEELANMQKNISHWSEYWSQNIENARNNLMMTYSDQWDALTRVERDQTKKLSLTFNKILPIVTQVVGEFSKSLPNINIYNSKTQDCEYIENILDKIKYESGHDSVALSCAQDIFVCGYSAIRICFDYESDRSFSKSIKYEHVLNPMNSFFDPSSSHPNKIDSEYAGSFSYMNRELYESKYGDEIDEKDFPNPQAKNELNNNNDNFTWLDNEGIALIDYTKKCHYSDILLKKLDGSSIYYSKYSKKENFQDLINIECVDWRPVERTKILHMTATYSKILDWCFYDSDDYDIKHLPYIYIDGQSYLHEDGRYRTRAYVELAHDAQRLHNFAKSELAEAIKYFRREEYIATKKMVDGYEQEWKNPEARTSLLIYNHDSMVPGGRPIKEAPSQLSPVILQSAVLSEMDVFSALGRFNENQGSESNAITGVAISKRIAQGNKSTYLYYNNLANGIQELFKVILNYMPIIYNDERNVSYFHSEKKKHVNFKINENKSDGKKVNDMLASIDMQVRVTSGSNEEDHILEVINILVEMMKINPQLSAVIPDIVASKLPFSFADKLTERLKLFLPPQVQQQEGIQGIPQQPNPQAQMDQMKMQNEGQKIDLEKQRIDMEKANLIQRQMDMNLKIEKIEHDDSKNKRDDLKHAINTFLETRKIIANSNKNE